MSGIAADLATLRADWQAVRGGWAQARRNARELVAHRRVLVTTAAPTKQGNALVLCTRLRLIGDTQTDVRRDWLRTAPEPEVAAATDAHFRAVQAAMQGWNIARAAERLLLQAIRLAGLLLAAAGILTRLLTAPRSQLLMAVLESPLLWTGVALPLLAEAVRIVLRWRLRALLTRA